MRLIIYGRVKTRAPLVPVRVGIALDLRQEFLSLYPSRSKHIYKTPADPKWKTRQIPLFSGMIDAAISAECDTYYGAFFGKQTRFAVLDVDIESKYHTAAELGKLASAIDSVGLVAKFYQSSNSGGWHLYIPFPEPSPSDEIAATLKRWLRALGYEIKSGVLEVFPSGNALRLPLQPGFAWLDCKGNLIRRREDLDLEEALSVFLQDLDESAADWQDAKSLIESQISLVERSSDRSAGNTGDGHEERLDISDFEHLFSRGRIKEIWEKGRKFWQDGLQKPGDRHNAILAVGHYLWYGDEEHGVQALAGGRYDKYRASLIGEWLEEKHNGMCRHINEGNWRIVKEQIQRAVIWRKKKEDVYEPYPLTNRLLKRLIAIYKKIGKVWSIPQFERANEASSLEARDRIAEAIKQLREEGQLITLAEIARRAGSHWRTVKKNSDLLVLAQATEEKSQQTESSSDLLARSAIVNNSGGRTPSGPSANEESPLHVSGSLDSDSYLACASIRLASAGSTALSNLPYARINQPVPLHSRHEFKSCPVSANFLHFGQVINSGLFEFFPFMMCLQRGSKKELYLDLQKFLEPANLHFQVKRNPVVALERLQRCLTPYAKQKAGRRRTTKGKRLMVLGAPSLPLNLAAGSSFGFGGSRNACGISGFPPAQTASPSLLILGCISNQAQVKPPRASERIKNLNYRVLIDAGGGLT